MLKIINSKLFTFYFIIPNVDDDKMIYYRNIFKLSHYEYSFLYLIIHESLKLS